MDNEALHMLTCPAERACGACQFLTVSYAEQLARKQAHIEALFAARAVPGAVRPIIGMDDPYHYRNKVASPFAPGKRIVARDVKGAQRESARASGRDTQVPRPGRNKRASRAAAAEFEILTGMYAAGTHRLVRTDGCLIENVEANRIVGTIRALMPRFGITPYREDANRGFLRHAIVRVGHTSSEVLVTLVTNGRAFPASRAFCRELVRHHPTITTVVQNINERQTNVILGEHEQTLYGPGFILDRLCGLSFRLSSQSFYQVNGVQTEVLYRKAVELARMTGTERVIDAYCGTGTIGLVAAKHGAAEVTGVDTVPSAIRDARQNARHNGVENARFAAADAGEFLHEAAAESRAVDVVFMDPPRSGSSEQFLAALSAVAPARIVYISCNPETQARDVRTLIDAGFRLRVVQPVDMFPHTDHIETIVLLEREGGC